MPTLPLDGFELSYEVAGDGPPMLFIAETACHGDVWKLHQVPEFSRDHSVITYDQRGTGRTTYGGTDFSTTSLAADAAALIDHVGLGPAVIYGHSMGGRVAQLVALDYPDRVSKLILASSGASHNARGIPIAMCIDLEAKGYERYMREHSVRIGFPEAFVRDHPEAVEAFLENRMANLPPLETFLRIVIARQEHDTADRLKDIRQPTLLMVGDDESHSSSGVSHLDSAMVLEAGIPDARLVTIPDAGHHYPFARPEAAIRAVRDFLEED